MTLTLKEGNLINLPTSKNYTLLADGQPVDVYHTKKFGHDITRLIIGDNPNHANTYIHDIYSGEEMYDYYTHDKATLNRVEALDGADGVICTILSGRVDVWQHDIKILKKYGVDTNVGDTRGLSGIFRFLRTAPDMMVICRDIEKYCPNAIFFNYTNENRINRGRKLCFRPVCH